MTPKPKLAIYWAAACGGCEIAVVNLHEKILELDAAFDLFFCPCLLDTKKSAVEALPDRALAVTLLNGAIRTSENEEMAHLLRRKSKLLIAFGSCAVGGGIPALANLHNPEALLRTVYLESPGLDNPEGVLPSPVSTVPEGTLTLPVLHDRVRTLAEVVAVDFFIPGCPPEGARLWEALAALTADEPPSPGAVLGGGELAVCHECPRRKEKKKIARLYRPWELVPDADRCLLEQGLLCMGLATRDGCGALCPQAGMACTGCYGPPPGVADQGAAMIAALGSILEPGERATTDGGELAARMAEFMESIPDWGGTLYKFSLANSILGGRVK